MNLEPKKTAKASLENKRGLLFNVSLLVSLLIVITAFEWRTYDKQQINLEKKRTNEFEQAIEIPVTEIPPPPPPPVMQNPRITEVSDAEEIEDIKIEFDIEVTEATKVESFTIVEPQEVEIKKEEVDEIFLVVEQSAQPKGGMSAFYKYVNEKIKYPAQARRMQIEGRVFVEFVVDKDGAITNVIVVKGIGAGCDEEAIRVVQGAPPWEPGRQRGKPVKQRLVLPITFKLA